MTATDSRSVLRRVLLYSAALAPIALAVIPWGDFQGHTHWNKVGWIPFLSPPIRVRDIVANVLLFCPLGAVIGAGSRSRHRLWRAAAIGAAVSCLVEWSQLFSHSRFPSATDLVCNTTGAVLAAWLVSRVTRGSQKHDEPHPERTRLA